MTLCILQTEQGEVAWAHVWKTQRGAVRSITNIYSLVITERVAGKLPISIRKFCIFY